MEIKTINVRLSTINITYPTVAEIYINDELVGYICENREDNRDKEPQSIILHDGKHFGDFCSVEHAVQAIARHHCGDQDLYIHAGADLKTDLLAALILALAGQNNAEQKNSPKEKTLH
ncbi:hypothetical protein FJB87_02490 [Salmonella enterica subsp. enterica]|uniref:hypothetical protein n=1 Tax=Salmonella enterica TaxID=28901 RepID=UPI0012D17AA9|nr:hypothetical protein [Salmonella enterica]EBG6922944.1 hypothetical protein [Salmonella enterica subsp. enterica]EBW9496388.1 hypothetical protein [Salmonella enterica subsp. enterica serovar Brandenburg]EBY2674721.1 hypothetical protein [Salmonella enterica subsp. enterica serovar Schwarzengrund]ECB7382950.1 hypothetical protein [Salmonella enterica subsp. enterica serovar Brandenburg]ECN6005733.1 hypothetical protein [Salmonella enterica subsp. enterica serovar Brandenburg]